MSVDSGLIQGNPRLRILNADKITVLKTLYLPYPDGEGGIQLTETPAKAIKHVLLNGAIRFIPGGLRHNLTINYSIYDPTYTKKTVGIADGNTPELTDLYDLIATYNIGQLSISPCSNKEIWFRVACTSDLKREAIYAAGFGNVSLTFEGLDVFATASATTPIG